MNELYKELEEKPYIDAFHYIEYIGEKLQDNKLKTINRFLKKDRTKQNKEIERLNNIINKTIKYCEESSMTLKSHYFEDVIKLLKGVI